MYKLIFPASYIKKEKHFFKKSDYKLIIDNLYIQKDYSKDKPIKFLIDFTYQKKRYRKVITMK